MGIERGKPSYFWSTLFSIALSILMVTPIMSAHTPVVSGVQTSGFVPISNQTGNYSLSYGEQSLFLFNNSLVNGADAPVYTGSIPIDMVYDSINSFLYVITWRHNVTGVGGMIVINTTSEMPVTTVNVGSQPWKEVFDPQNGNIYIYTTPALMVVVNGSTNQVSDEFHAGTYISDMVFDSTDNLIYATDAYSDNVTMIDPTSNAVAGKIDIGAGSSSIVYDSNNNYLYVSHSSVWKNNTTVLNSGIFVIDPNNDKIISSIPEVTGGQLLLDPTSNTLYCSNYDAGYITIINTQENVVEKQVTTYSSDGGGGTVYDPVNHDLYYTGWNVTTPNTILVMNTSNYDIIKSIHSIPPAYGLIYVPSTQTVYESGNDNSIKNINGTTNNVTNSIILKWAPNFVYYDPSNSFIYIGNGEDGWQGTSANDIDRINSTTSKVVSYFNGGASPVSMTVDPENGFMYIADFTSGPGMITVVNVTTEEIVETISFAYHLTQVNYVMYDHSNNCVYAIGYFSHFVTGGSVYYDGYAEVINPTNNSIIKSIPLGYAPSAAAYDPANGMIYVANWYSNNLTVINGTDNSVVSSIPTGKNPSFVKFDPQNNLLYVTDYGSNSTTVIDTNTSEVVYNLSTPGHPDAVGIDPILHLVLIANSPLNEVTLIDERTNSVIGSIPVGDNPDFITFDPQNSLTYVANHDSGTISVINFGKFMRAFQVSLEESGLPSEKQWSVDIWYSGCFVSNGSSMSSRIMLNLPNGTYNYNISIVHGYSVSPENGTFTVNGHEVALDISFRPTQFLGIPFNILIPALVVSVSLIVIATTLWLRKRKNN